MATEENWSYQGSISFKIQCLTCSTHSLWTHFCTKAWALPNSCKPTELFSLRHSLCRRETASLPCQLFSTDQAAFLPSWTNGETWLSKLNIATACNESPSRNRYGTAEVLQSLWFAAWINLMDKQATVPRISLIMHCENRLLQENSPNSKLPKENQPWNPL